jgi:hypothetical protein
MFSWTYALIIYCCHGNSTQLKKNLVKEQNVQPLKPHWRGPFVVSLSTPTAVKLAEIASWIHHSQVKPASLQWECIPDPASLCRITLQNLSSLPPRQDSASQETTGDQERQNNCPALVTLGSWLVYAWQKLEESTLQRDKWTVFHTSYFTVSVLSLLVGICCCSSHPSLRHRFGKNHSCWLDSRWKAFISSLLSLLGRMHHYCLLLLIWSPFIVPEPSCDPMYAYYLHRKCCH